MHRQKEWKWMRWKIFSSDLFSVALIGFEMMTTRPMYDGSISAIQESAQRADVSMRLNQAMVAGWLDPHTHDFRSMFETG